MAAAAWLVAGCAQFGGGDLGAIYQAAKVWWSGGQPVSLKEAASVPYASIGVQLGSSNQILLVLATEQNGQRFWTSAAKFALMTKDGRIVRSAGLPYNLGGFQQRQDTTNNDGSRTIRWLADLPDIGLYSLPVTCRRQYTGNQTIQILGANIQTRHFNETCTAETNHTNWSFKNQFWTDTQSSLVWKSIQYIHPKLEPIAVVTLRPTE